MTELPLFFSHASPDNILSLLPGHGVAMAGSPMMLPSQLSGLLPSFRQPPESDLMGASLCIEPDMSDLSPDLSQKRAPPGCRPLPEGSTSVPVPIADDRPGHSQTAWILPVNKRVPSINTAIPETHEKTSVFPLPCEQDACVAWDYGGRIIVLDISEIILSAEPVTDETKALTPWTVIPTVDQEGNIIYQWHDHDGHLHTISEWEFMRRLSMYFQSLLEFLYPEYFGSSLPAGGGWHQWQYWKVRRTEDHPGNADQQPWQTCRTRRKSNNKKVKPVAVVQPVQHRPTRYQPRHQNGRPQPSPSGKATATERTVENEIDQLLMEFKSGYMQSIAKKHNKNYDGKKHGQYCVKIKTATETRRKPLTDNEKLTFMPFMRHLSKVVYSFNEISLSACIHSLTVSQLLYPPRSARKTNTDPDDGGKNIKQAQAALIKSLISRVQTLKMLKQGFGTQTISNQLWALEKLVANELLPVNQDGLASQAVMALLPQVQTPPEPFISQHISSLLLSLAKLVENGLLQLNQGGLASQAVMALLPQVQSSPEPFDHQGISNLLLSLAKLVENGLLQLNQDGLTRKAVMALLPQVQSPPEPFNHQEISSLLRALTKLVRNGLLPLDQGGLTRKAVMALLPQVQSHLDDFTSQEISNLLWALSELVENGLLPLDQGGLTRKAVMALLPQVQSPPEPFNHQDISSLLRTLANLVESGLLSLDQNSQASQAVMVLLPQVHRPPEPLNPQEISNLLRALAKLVENGLLQRDQNDLASQAVMALLPQVQSPPEPFISQHVSNLLWALAKLVENRLLQLNQDGLTRKAVMALLPQVQSPPEPFISQHVSNLLWALSILVKNGLLSLDQDGLTRKAVMALLPQVQSLPEPFNPQDISNLLWALAKLVENGLLSLDHLTRKAVMALLPQVQSPPKPFNPQEISNLLWALAKLVGQGLQLNQNGLASQAVMTLLPQVQSHLDDFTSQGISNLLWALAMLGDGVSLDAVIDLLRLMNINTVESWREQETALWALTVFLARGGETSLLLSQMKILYDALTAEKENRSDVRATTMRLSGVWLGENQQDLPPTHYETIISRPHQELYRILKDCFSGHTLEMEASVNGLPPVDLLFPDNRVVIEVQGGHHYVDKEKKLRNGSTILKVMTYGKLGYKVFEIPASDVDDKKTQEQLQRELRAYFSNEGNSANSSTESDPETAEEDSYFSAAEEL